MHLARDARIAVVVIFGRLGFRIAVVVVNNIGVTLPLHLRLTFANRLDIALSAVAYKHSSLFFFGSEARRMAMSASQAQSLASPVSMAAALAELERQEEADREQDRYIDSLEQRIDAEQSATEAVRSV